VDYQIIDKSHRDFHTNSLLEFQKYETDKKINKYSTPKKKKKKKNPSIMKKKKNAGFVFIETEQQQIKKIKNY
jgi:hypothetical protein